MDRCNAGAMDSSPSGFMAMDPMLFATVARLVNLALRLRIYVIVRITNLKE